MASYSEEIVSELYRNRRDYFGHDMKEEQCKIITATLNRKNVMAILPTGFGKSFCYAVLPFIQIQVKNYENSCLIH